jgi:hypothetical protein
LRFLDGAKLTNVELFRSDRPLQRRQQNILPKTKQARPNIPPKILPMIIPLRRWQSAVVQDEPPPPYTPPPEIGIISV